MMTSRMEKTMPATAAARGVRRCEYMTVSSWSIADLVA
jgi:hypothetical protein